MNVQPGYARTPLPGIATLFPRVALCYTQPRALLRIFVKQSHAPEFFGRGLLASCDWNTRSWKEPRQPLREVPPAELSCTRKQVVWYCAPEMTNPSDDLSRRSFLKASLAGAAVSLAKVPAATETKQKDQRKNA